MSKFDGDTKTDGDIFIKFRAEPQDTTIEVPHDFEHVQTLEGLKETFRQSYYHVYTKIREEKTIVSKLIHTPPKVDENQVSYYLTFSILSSCTFFKEFFKNMCSAMRIFCNRKYSFASQNGIFSS